MKKIIFLLASLLSVSAFAQDKAAVPAPKAPVNWFNLQHGVDSAFGIQTERTYAELTKGLVSETIVVCVLDGGVDYNHEDLKNVMWHNPGEIPGNGIDDDKNGYIDDVYGWNFIGGKDGKSVDHEQTELTRLYKPLYEKYGKTGVKGNGEEYKRYLELKKAYDKELSKAMKLQKQFSPIIKVVGALKKDIRRDRGLDSTAEVSYNDFKNYHPSDRFQRLYLALSPKIKTEADWNQLNKELAEGDKEINAMLNYHYNLDYDGRRVVGDNPLDVNDHNYGNNDVKGPDALHGTHVAGIIAAQRDNGIGIKGVAGSVRIMAVRVVPDGDERDKDVANGIRYAVDNGAKIINMSFGKSYGTNKAAVDEAVKYAASKGVLIIHAAGNDGKNIDKQDDFPSAIFADGGRATNWIEVGASSWMTGKKAVAPFSNYGHNEVDVFAPGVDIMSCESNGTYIPESGTSMASPVCAGAAAVLKSYFPQLTPAQIKQAIESSSDKSMAGEKVIIPGKKKKKAKFSKLSRTGGVVDLYDAFKAAEKLAGK